MITVLTMTYKRHKILEEAIYSFLLQDYDAEMLIINDCPDVIYSFDHPRVRIINCSTRFSSLGKKLEYGFKEAKGDIIYRLDDDDLLAPNALKNVEKYYQNKGYDIYRSRSMYYFCDNKYQGISQNVNTGNAFTKEFISRIEFPDVSIVEDVKLIYESGGRIYEGEELTMIYRWGSFTYHISALGVHNAHNEELLKVGIELSTVEEKGHIILNPSFMNDYWGVLNISNE